MKILVILLYTGVPSEKNKDYFISQYKDPVINQPGWLNGKEGKTPGFPSVVQLKTDINDPLIWARLVAFPVYLDTERGGADRW